MTSKSSGGFSIQACDLDLQMRDDLLHGIVGSRAGAQKVAIQRLESWAIVMELKVQQAEIAQMGRLAGREIKQPFDYGQGLIELLFLDISIFQVGQHARQDLAYIHRLQHGGLKIQPAAC